MAYGIIDFGVITGKYQAPTSPLTGQILGFSRRW